MVAFVVSILGLVAMIGIFWWYKDRTPRDHDFTWGEAMVFATFVFSGFFLAYGIVPHQWLVWADNELNWRPDRTVWGIGNILRPEAEGGWLPLTISWLTIRDLIAVTIYGILLGVNIWLWSVWQNRGKDDTKVVEKVSEYGRPLVKEGV
ncbi:MAG: hypothetical protein OES57_03895 [Acidimicrobiia bacterium]|nr:hypothetical protein [Acidimicrobiia bacterium]